MNDMLDDFVNYRKGWELFKNKNLLPVPEKIEELLENKNLQKEIVSNLLLFLNDKSRMKDIKTQTDEEWSNQFNFFDYSLNLIAVLGFDSSHLELYLKLFASSEEYEKHNYYLNLFTYPIKNTNDNVTISELIGIANLSKDSKLKFSAIKILYYSQIELPKIRVIIFDIIQKRNNLLIFESVILDLLKKNDWSNELFSKDLIGAILLSVKGTKSNKKLALSFLGCISLSNLNRENIPERIRNFTWEAYGHDCTNFINTIIISERIRKEFDFSTFFLSLLSKEKDFDNKSRIMYTLALFYYQKQEPLIIKAIVDELNVEENQKNQQSILHILNSLYLTFPKSNIDSKIGRIYANTKNWQMKKNILYNSKESIMSSANKNKKIIKILVNDLESSKKIEFTRQLSYILKNSSDKIIEANLTERIVDMLRNTLEEFPVTKRPNRIRDAFDESIKKRFGLMDIIKEIGEPGIKFGILSLLVYILKTDRFHDIRQLAAYILGTYEEKGAKKSVVKALTQALENDQNVMVQMQAASAIADLGSAALKYGSLEILVNSAKNHKDIWVRKSSIEALGLLGFKTSFSIVLHKLKKIGYTENEAYVKEGLINVLSEFCKENPTDELIVFLIDLALRDDDYGMRRAALNILQTRGQDLLRFNIVPELLVNIKKNTEQAEAAEVLFMLTGQEDIGSGVISLMRMYYSNLEERDRQIMEQMEKLLADIAPYLGYSSDELLRIWDSI